MTSTPNNDWVLSLGSALGTNNVWSVDGVSGVISFTGGLSYAGTDMDMVIQCTGRVWGN